MPKACPYVMMQFAIAYCASLPPVISHWENIKKSLSAVVNRESDLLC